MWWHLTWKNIHVELKFFILKFHHFIFLLLPRISSFFFIYPAFFFVLQRCKSEDQIIQVPTQFNRPINQIGSPSVQSSNRPDRLIVLPLFFGAPNHSSSNLFFLCSSSDRSSFVLLQICSSSSTKIESQRLGFAFQNSSLQDSRSMWHHTSNSPSGNRVFNPQVLD